MFWAETFGCWMKCSENKCWIGLRMQWSYLLMLINHHIIICGPQRFESNNSRLLFLTSYRLHCTHLLIICCLLQRLCLISMGVCQSVDPHYVDIFPHFFNLCIWQFWQHESCVCMGLNNFIYHYISYKLTRTRAGTSGGVRLCCVGGRRQFQGGAKFTNLVN